MGLTLNIRFRRKKKILKILGQKTFFFKVPAKSARNFCTPKNFSACTSLKIFIAKKIGIKFIYISGLESSKSAFFEASKTSFSNQLFKKTRARAWQALDFQNFFHFLKVEYLGYIHNKFCHPTPKTHEVMQIGRNLRQMLDCIKNSSPCQNEDCFFFFKFQNPKT